MITNKIKTFIKKLNVFARLKQLEEKQSVLISAHNNVAGRQNALQDYLDIDYFNGEVYKPHYRKRKVVKKKLGRPRKNT